MSRIQEVQAPKPKRSPPPEPTKTDRAAETVRRKIAAGKRP
jgi:hypothetical protein